MLQPEKIPAGQRVGLNVGVSKSSHSRLKKLRSAIEFHQNSEVNLLDVYQMAVEAGIESLEKHFNLQPTEA